VLKKRVIPVLTTNGFGLVKTKGFQNPRMLGNPIQAAKVFNNRNVDELIFLDIYATRQNRELDLINVQRVIDECFMPVGIGGGIKSLQQIENLLKIGADKVIISTAFLKDIDFVVKAIDVFGSQCISISLDAIKRDKYYFHINDSSRNLLQLIELANSIQVGEIILTSVNFEGEMKGFDNELYDIVLPKIKSPVIVHGGAANPEDFAKVPNQQFISGYAASSIYAYTQYTPNDVKLCLKNMGNKTRVIE
jgi:cyclase